MPFGVRNGLLAVTLALAWAAWLPAQQQPQEAVPEQTGPVPAPKREGLFVREPESPEDLLDAAGAAVNLGKPELARKYLQQLLDSNPDNATLFALRRDRGPGPFLRLTRVRELKPLADTLLRRVDDASRSFARDPQRRAQLIALLGASATERAWAISELRSAGSAAVPPLLEALRHSGKPDTEAGAYDALRFLGKDATPVLIGALGTDDARLEVQMIGLVAQRGDREAVPYLWTPAASPQSDRQVRQTAREAIARLTGKPFGSFSPTAELLDEARRYDEGKVQFPSTADGLAEVWRWDAAGAMPVADRLSAEQASRVLATFFARQALDLSPESRQAQFVFLMTALARDVAAAGPGQPLPHGPGTAFDLALSSGPELPAMVLRQALSQRRHALALAATQVLGQVGGEALLYPEGNRASLLLEAVRYPERRVQFAAAEAILGLRPTRPVRGSSEVIAVLSRAVRTRGEAKALVADPELERGQRLAGLADQLGYSTEVAVNGRDTFRKAVASADYDLILLDLNILGWGLSETLTNLRGDSRTAGIPVYLVGPLKWSSVARRYSKQYDQVRYVVRPTVSQDLALQLEGNQPDSAPLSAAERLGFAQRAVHWLYAIASGQIHVGDAAQALDALEDALEEPELAADAVPVLALLPRPEAQQALAEVTLDDRRPTELRQRAAEGLCDALRKFGVLLEPAQREGLQRLVDTTGDAELHASVSAVAGCLGEDPHVAGQRLQRYRAAPVPAEGPTATAPEETPPAQPSEQP